MAECYPRPVLGIESDVEAMQLKGKAAKICSLAKRMSKCRGENAADGGHETSRVRLGRSVYSVQIGQSGNSFESGEL